MKPRNSEMPLLCNACDKNIIEKNDGYGPRQYDASSLLGDYYLKNCCNECLDAMCIDKV